MQTEQFTFTTRDEKKQYVRSMFSGIAERYDFLNHFLSFGLDNGWRNKAVKMIRGHVSGVHQPQILDVACGTGDLSFEALKQIPDAALTGIDLAKPMLEVFEKKAAERKANVIISEGDVEALQFVDHTFDAVMIGFGTRNFTNLDIAFTEIYRVLKPGGIFVNLELSKPRRIPMKQLYSFYSKRILPRIGKSVSRHSQAYSYLPDSVERFPEREEIIAKLRAAGFASAQWSDLTAGIVTIHKAIK